MANEQVPSNPMILLREWHLADERFDLEDWSRRVRNLIEDAPAAQAPSKEMSLDEALELCRKHATWYPNVPSVSRALMHEIERLQIEVARVTAKLQRASRTIERFMGDESTTHEPDADPLVHVQVAHPIRGYDGSLDVRIPRSSLRMPQEPTNEPPAGQPFAWVRDDRPEGVPLISFRADKPTVPGSDAWFPVYRASQPPDTEAIATKVVHSVCELPDYDSPADQHELLSCTTKERTERRGHAKKCICGTGEACSDCPPASAPTKGAG